MKTLYVAIALLFLYSCKKETTETIEAAPETTTTEAAPAVTLKKGNTAALIAGLIAKKKQVQSELTSLSADEANALYDTYKNENDSILKLLEYSEQNLLDRFYTYYSTEQGEAKSPPDSIAKKEALLKSANLEFWEIGEGYVEIRTTPHYYLNIFKGHVTKDYEEFIALMAKDDEELYSADAGLTISFNALGKRVLNWENFIAKNPYSKQTPGAIQIYRQYQEFYLLGMDNTPTIAFETNTFYPENIAEFKQFSTKHPNSKTVPLINAALAFKGTKDEMYSFVENTQRQLIDKIEADATPDYQ